MPEIQQMQHDNLDAQQVITSLTSITKLTFTFSHQYTKVEHHHHTHTHIIHTHTHRGSGITYIYHAVIHWAMYEYKLVL